MVFVNQQKYACGSCIKGHRSSTCQHVHRPLYAVRPKGRPVTQCPECRKARKSSQFHGRCSCPSLENQSALPAPSRASASLGEPAFPNGIKDLLQSIDAVPLKRANHKQNVNTLLNPCSCEDVHSCKCQRQTSPASPQTSRPACCGNTPRPPSNFQSHQSRKLDLPPILISDTSRLVSDAFQTPPALSMPNLTTISSIAGTGCTCGVTCECPGCEDHHVESEHEHDSRSEHTADMCGSCVDYTGSMSFNGRHDLNDAFYSSTSTSLPASSTVAGIPFLDPHNVRVYLPAVLAQMQAAQVPKLQCCAGKCTCPVDQCGCSDGCTGCGADQSQRAGRPVAHASCCSK